MHIPNHMIDDSVCQVTSIISVIGITTAAYLTVKSKVKSRTARLCAISAFIFAAQMLNFPIQNGTSGHLIGATLLATLFGFPLGALMMSIILTIQCLVFSDGGLIVLGANILNMAIIGSIPGGVVHKLINKEEKYILRDLGLIGIASWISVVLSAFACSIELGISGTIGFLQVVPAMVSIHAVIGVGEGIITCLTYLLFSSNKISQSKKLSFGVPLAASGVVAALLSPFASTYPDGLEWVAQQYNFIHESAPAFVSPLADYKVLAINNEIISIGLAGLTGVAITFVVSLLVVELFKLNDKKCIQ